MQLRIDQKSMPPSNKKRDLKNRICDYNAKFYGMEQRFKKIQLLFKKGETQDSDDIKLSFETGDTDSSDDAEDEKPLNESCDMEFDIRS